MPLYIILFKWYINLRKEYFIASFRVIAVLISSNIFREINTCDHADQIYWLSVTIATKQLNIWLDLSKLKQHKEFHNVYHWNIVALNCKIMERRSGLLIQISAHN